MFQKFVYIRCFDTSLQPHRNFVEYQAQENRHGRINEQ